MNRSKRSLFTKQCSRRVSSCVSHLHSLKKVALEGNTQGATLSDVSNNLLVRSLSRSKTNVWYRILPMDDHSEDHISSGMGHPWEDVLPILTNLGFIRSKRRSTVNSYEVAALQWENFCLTFPGPEKLHFGCFRGFGKQKEYFLCRGAPHFKSPQQQITAVCEKTFKIHKQPHYYDQKDSIL